VDDQSWVDAEFLALVCDQVLSPVALVDPVSARVVGRAEGSVWGLVSGSVVTPCRFPGQYCDDESGLHDNRFRYYQPGVGRYVSPDPLGFAPSPNPYAYPANPTVVCDPLGLAPCRSSEVWDRVEATQPPRIGSAIPKSFKLRISNGETIWASPNATKHISEDLLQRDLWLLRHVPNRYASGA